MSFDHCLVVGSINIDCVFSVRTIVKPGETIPSTKYEENVGGKGLNQAVALQQAGVKTALAATIGSDGLYIIDKLQVLGVDTTFVKVEERLKTGRAVIQVANEGENAIILFQGANGHVEYPSKEQLQKYTNPKWLLLQGEINMDAQQAAISDLSSKGCIVALNAAPISPELIKCMKDNADLVQVLFVNETELVELAKSLLLQYGETSSSHLLELVKDISRKLCQTLKGIKLIVTTLGPLGACTYFAESKSFLHEPVSRPVEVIDTVGAGDTFIGFFIAQMSSKAADLQDAFQDVKLVTLALRRAVLASGLCCEKSGALPSIPSSPQVDAISKSQQSLGVA